MTIQIQVCRDEPLEHKTGIQCGTVYITRTLKKVEMEHDI